MGYQQDASAGGSVPPPIAARVGAEPYSWITDPGLPEVAAYLAAERDYYDGRVRGLRAGAERLGAEMVARVPGSEPLAPWDSAGFRYRYRAAPGADHPALVREPLDQPGTEQVLLDLQAVDDRAGTGYCETGHVEVSPDGRRLAWSVDLAGDEVYGLRFRDLASGEDLPEVRDAHVLRRGVVERLGGVPLHRARRRLPPVPGLAPRARHRPRATTGWCSRRTTSASRSSSRCPRTGAWAVIRLVARGTSEEWLVPTADLTRPPALVRARQHGVEYALEHAPGARPRCRRRRLPRRHQPRRAGVPRSTGPRQALPATWTPVVAEDPAVRVHAVDAFAGGYVLSLRTEGAAVLRVVPARRGLAYQVASPTPGGWRSLGRNDDFAAAAVTVVVESFVEPPVHLDVDLASGQRRERHRMLAVGVDPDAYVCERLLAPARTGCRCRSSSSATATPPSTARRPACCTATGPTRRAATPTSASTGGARCRRCSTAGWCSPSATRAAAGSWAGAGGSTGTCRPSRTPSTTRRPSRTTSPTGSCDGRRIVTRGLSAGGLLQGALYSRRPERWAGVLAEVPFVDVVTTMLDPSLPLTMTEWDEWGDPRDPLAREVMSSYSPIDNPPPVEGRPPLLVTGAVHDPRVLVREPAKWVAALRHDDPERGVGTDPASPVSPRSVLFRCETGAGAHAGPPGRYGQLHYEAEVLAWCLAALGVSV